MVKRTSVDDSEHLPPGIWNSSVAIAAVAFRHKGTESVGFTSPREVVHQPPPPVPNELSEVMFASISLPLFFVTCPVREEAHWMSVFPLLPSFVRLKATLVPLKRAPLASRVPVGCVSSGAAEAFVAKRQKPMRAPAAEQRMRNVLRIAMSFLMMEQKN